MRTNRTQKGQALVLITLAIVALIAITGLAVDTGNAYLDRREAQNAADSAALAAALAQVHGSNITTVAQSRAASNGYDNNGTSNSVVVATTASPTGSCPGGVTGLDITVTITSNVNTSLANIIGISQITNKVLATSRSCSVYSSPFANGNAVVGLAPSGCNTVAIAGNAQLQTWGGGIYSNSKDTCGLVFQGSSQTQTHGPGGISMVAGGYTTIGNPTVDDHGNGIFENQQQIPYPPPGLPNPTCSGNASVSGSTMSAGNYTGTFPPSGVTNLNPGIYCIFGDFVMHGGQLTGSGVTIVLENGAIDWNGNAQPNLSAPTSGPYQGLLIDAPVSNTNTMRINGNSNSTLTGTVLLPGAAIVVNGNNSQLQKTDSQLIGYTVDLSGSSDTQIVESTADQYQAFTSPTITLIK